MLNLKSLLQRLSKSNMRTYSNTNVNEKPIELAKNNQNISKLVIDECTPYRKHTLINKLFRNDFVYIF